MGRVFQSRFQDSFQIKDYDYQLFQVMQSVSIPFPGFVSNQVRKFCIKTNIYRVSIPFPGFVSNQGNVKGMKVLNDNCFNPVSRIRFKSSNLDFFDACFKRVSIPFPGFVSNQALTRGCYTIMHD